MNRVKSARPRLTRALTHEALQRVADGMGGYRETWVSLGLVWADIQPGTGRIAGGEFHATATTPYRIILRWMAPGSPDRPQPEQRLREGSRVFRILAVSEEDPHGLYLNLSAVEEVVA